MRRRTIVVALSLALVGTTLAAIDVLGRRLAVARAERLLGDCVTLTALKVDLGPPVVVLRALRGRLDDVHVTAAAADIAGVRLRDLRADVQRVSFGILGGFDDARVTGAAVSLRVYERDLARALERLGSAADLRIGDRGIEIGPRGGGTAILVRVRAQGGAVVVAPAGALGTVFALRIVIPGVEVRRILHGPAELRVEAVAAGPARRIACDARRSLETRLRSLSTLLAMLPNWG